MLPSRLLLGSCLLALCVPTGLPSLAQDKLVEIPTGGTPLLDARAVTSMKLNAHPDLATSAQLRGPDQRSGTALEVAVLQVPPQPWNVQAVTPLQGEIRRGDVLLLTCRLRCLAATSEEGEGRLSINVQRNRAPHDKLLALPVSVGIQWQQVVHPFRAPFGLAQDEVNLTIHLGLQQQKLQIAELQLVNYGRAKELNELPATMETYRGRGPEGAWRSAAEKRINQLRRAPLRIVVQDDQGNALADATVQVKMQRHRFPFGSAVAAKLLASESDDARRYREAVASNYNKVVFENDLKWAPWEVSKSNRHNTFRREWTEAAFQWLAANHIAVRGHYITWAPLRPQQLSKYQGRGELLRRELWEHMQDKIPAVGERVTDWDVINHVVGWGDTIETVVGSRHVYVEIIQLSRELASPEVELWINEGQVLPSGQRRKDYERMARYLIDQGAPLDGIGFMGHFGAHSLTPPDELYEVFDQFAELSENLQITELDVDVGGDEQLQADYLRDVMTIAFSHPKMRSIMMWGFWEGRHWKPDAALFRRDWSLKPAGRVWRELVSDRWWTDTSVTTDSQGACTVEGFLGQYTIEASADGRTRRVKADLAKPGATMTIRL